MCAVKSTIMFVYIANSAQKAGLLVMMIVQEGSLTLCKSSAGVRAEQLPGICTGETVYMVIFCRCFLSCTSKQCLNRQMQGIKLSSSQHLPNDHLLLHITNVLNEVQ